MASLVKANATLMSGNLAVLKRSFSTNDQGIATYSVQYVCLKRFANRWTSTFRVNNEPPTPLPEYILGSALLTKNPTLFDIQTETINGLTYFNVQYSAGVQTEVIETISSEQRSLSYTFVTTRAITPYLSANILITSEEVAVNASFDYISYSVTRSTTNVEAASPVGSVGQVFNCINCNAQAIKSGSDSNARAVTVESATRTRRSNGEYSINVTSTGLYIDALGGTNDTPRALPEKYQPPISNAPKTWKVYPRKPTWAY